MSPLFVGGRKIYGTATSNPGSATEGDIYWNSNDNVYKYYDGSSWQTVANESLGESPGFAASNAAAIYATGNRTNGYYWIKGDGTRAARLMYCILDASWGSGGGWMVVANHDGAKEQHAGHQPRVTAIPTTVSYTTADFNSKGGLLSWNGSNRARRLNYTAYGYSWPKAFANASANSGGDSTFRLNGSSASTADYPVWICYATLSGSLGSGTFSFTDSASGGTQSATGWDDFQDGSGMGDGWEVETQGNSYARGYPSLIALQ